MAGDGDESWSPPRTGSKERGRVTLEELGSLVRDLKETVATQHVSLHEIRDELRQVKSQNLELQSAVRSLESKLEQTTASSPPLRSWASVANGSNVTQAPAGPTAPTKYPEPTKEPHCLRISTKASQVENDGNEESLTRNLPVGRAIGLIREALHKTDQTKDVDVTGINTTRTGYVVRCKDEQSAQKAKTHTEWLQELGNNTKLVKPRYAVVVHRFPTEGIELPEHEDEFTRRLMEENDMPAKTFKVDGATWLREKSKHLGYSATLGIWFDTEEAAQDAITHGIVYGQRHMGVSVYDPEKKKCYNCRKPGHFQRNCPRPKECHLCKGDHDRRNCPSIEGNTDNNRNRLDRNTIDEHNVPTQANRHQ